MPGTALEVDLLQAANAARIATGDVLLYALWLEKVLRRMREVAPELVAAAEAEVDSDWLAE